MSAPSELQLTAYHEAGHATMSHLRDVAVFKASVVATAHVLGHIRREAAWGAAKPFCAPERRQRATTDIEIFLAGPVAEACRIASVDSGDDATVECVMSHFERTASGQPDLKNAVRVAKAISFSTHEANHLVRHLAWRTAGRFARSRRIWNAVSTLATALVEHGELDGSHVHWLLRRALNGRTHPEVRASLAARVARGPYALHLGLSRAARDHAV